jgi:hypothetical protein
VDSFVVLAGEPLFITVADEQAHWNPDIDDIKAKSASDER